MKLTVQEAAAVLGKSERYLRDLLIAGRIRGAERVGTGRRGIWLIPVGANGKPTIKPVKRGRPREKS